MFAFLLALTVFAFPALITAAPVEADAVARGSPTGPWPPFFTGTTLHPYDKRGRVMRHKCLDVAGQVYADGTHVQIWDCNGTPAQKWNVAYGTVNKIWANNAPGLGYCLDATTPNPGDGTKLVIKACDTYEEHRDTQMWRYGAWDFKIQFGGNMQQCVDVTDGNSWNGNQVQTWTCHDPGHPDYNNQQFFPGARL